MMRVTLRGRQSALATMLLLAVATAASASAAEAPLYERLGGEVRVAAFVGETIDYAASAPHLERSFEDVDLARVKRLIVEQICELTGGGCRYSGDSMRDVHAGMGLTQSEMYGLVEALRNAMRRHGVGLRERNELLAILAPMKRDIVER